MTTFLQLAEFARAAYGDPIPNSQDWKALQPIQINDVDCYGQAYKNEKTHEIIITYRGTRPTSLNDLINDANLSLHIETRSQETAAYYAGLIADANPDYKIILTGHSLGGNLAQAATASLTDKGVNASAVLFNAPGIGGWKYAHNSTDYNVLNIVSRTDTIHFAGGDHLGTELTINTGQEFGPPISDMPPAFQGLVGRLVGIGYYLATSVGPGHSINTIVSYLGQANTALGAEHWPPIDNIGQPALSHSNDYIANTLNSDVKLDTDTTIHLRGLNGIDDQFQSTYALKGTDRNGDELKISNDNDNHLAYQRDSGNGEKIALTAQPHVMSTLFASASSYTANGGVYHESGQAEVSLTYHGVTKTIIWNYSTGEYKYYQQSDGTTMSVTVAADKSYRFDWTGSHGTGVITRASDGTYDAVYDGIPATVSSGFLNSPYAARIHINPDGSGYWNKTYNGNWETAELIDLYSDGTAIRKDAQTGGSTRVQYPTTFDVQYVDYNVNLYVGKPIAPEINHDGGIKVTIDNLSIRAGTPQRVGDASGVALFDNNDTIAISNAWGDTGVSVTDKQTNYDFRNGLLHNYTAPDAFMASTSNGALLSAITSDYRIKLGDASGNYIDDLTTISQRQSDGTWHTTRFTAPGIYKETWTEQNIQYTKDVNIDIVTTTTKNQASGEWKKTSVDKSGKIVTEAFGINDQVLKASEYSYASDNSYNVATLDNAGTSVSHYDTVGKLIEVQKTNSDNTIITTYVYDPESGSLRETVIKSTASDMSVTEAHFDIAGRKILEIWNDVAGNTSTSQYYADGSYDTIKKISEGTVTEANYNKHGDLYFQKEINPDGAVITKDYFYNESYGLSKVVEHRNGSIITTTYDIDGTSVEKSVNDDGSYSLITKNGDGQHSEFYAADGHLDHEIDDSNVGSDRSYYDASGKIVHQEHADLYGMTSKDFNADGSYTERYGGANGNYTKMISATGILLYSKGHSSDGATWEITYDNFGAELVNKWENRDGDRGEIDHRADGSVVSLTKLINGSIDASISYDGKPTSQALVGSYYNDKLLVNGAANFVAGSYGDDSIDVTSGHNVVAYNIGDGRDTIISKGSSENTLSLGGGITYDMIEFSKSDSDLVLNFWGNTQAIVLKDWYQEGTVQEFSKLQLVQNSPDTQSSDPLQSQKFQIFDLAGLVRKFDEARAMDSSVVNWHVETSLSEFSLNSNSVECIGGGLAVDYALSHSISVDLVGISTLLAHPNFGQSVQLV